MNIAAAAICLCLYAPTTGAQVIINISGGNEHIKTEPVDEVSFTVQYEMTWVRDTLDPDRRLNETMMLNVGARRSVFYSYSRYLSDSVARAGRDAGLSIDAIAEQLSRLHSSVSYKIYKNYPDGKVTTLDQVAMNRFRCEETNDAAAWEIVDDTTSILGYHCQKAVCRFRGRDYEAWFTSEIPRSEGPWKLYGLPGLILKAADSQRHYVFECTGLVQNRDGAAILYGDTGYEPISRRNLNRQFERNAADPVGYAQSANARIVHKGADGQSIEPKNMPYNPIERGEE